MSLSSSLKKEITALLYKGEYLEILKLYHSPNKIINRLISISYDKQLLIAWKAIEAIGTISQKMALQNPESLRILVGKLLWMIREESGGIGWSVPEILGEIVRNNPDSCKDIARILVSFHEERILTPGVLWAIGRMGRIDEEMLKDAIPVVISYLKDHNYTIRANAIYAIGEIGRKEHIGLLKHRNTKNLQVIMYIDGQLKRFSLPYLKERAIMKLSSLPG